MEIPSEVIDSRDSYVQVDGKGWKCIDAPSLDEARYFAQIQKEAHNLLADYGIKVPEVYDLIEHEGMWYMVMEHLDGFHPMDYTFPEREHLFEYLKSTGLIHRDLHYRDILYLTNSDQFAILDFDWNVYMFKGE